MIFFRWKNASRFIVFVVSMIALIQVLPDGYGLSGSVLAQSAANVIKVEGAQQTTYSRLLLPLPASTIYNVRLTGQELRVTIEGRFRVDFSALRSGLLRQVGNGRSTRTGEQTILVFDTLPNVSPRDFRSGEFLVLDVYGGDLGAVLPRSRGNQVAAATPPSPPSQTENAQGTIAAPPTAAADDSPTAQTEGTDGDSATPSPGPAATSEDAEGPEPIEELANNSDSEETEAVPTDAADQLRDPDVVDIKLGTPRIRSNLILSGISDAIGDPEKKIVATAAKADNGIVMRFSWPEESALAVFQRGRSLWLIFDQPFSFDPEGLVNAGNLVTDRVLRVAQRPHRDALILRMKIVSDQNAVVERDRNDWLVYLKDTPAQPRFPLVPMSESDTGQGQQVFVPATEIGRKVEFEDPDVGDMLVALPMLRQGYGLPEDHNYAAADLLQSAQGLVVSPQTDFVSVERFRDGIAIRSTGNGELASTLLESVENENEGGFSRLIDFARWRLGPEWEYRKFKERLFYELSLEPVDNRNRVRWKIARFFLGHGRASESLGILELMLHEDPLYAQNTDFLAVRGVANFKQGRYAAAEADLSSRELEFEQDAELWRALVAEAMGNNEEALEFYRKGRDIMGTYDVSDRAEIELAVIRAAIATGDLEQAQQELSLINGMDMTENQVAEAVFQSARIAEKQGQTDIAYAQYEELSSAPQRWVAARARYAGVIFGVQNGKITLPEGIDELERLRFVWREDEFEAQLLDDLAGYYFETKQYQKGLESLQQGLSYFPEIARRKRMLLRMSEVFKDLFYQNGADELSPISAIALFFKFRDLTPLGSEGDLMIRRLSDRLVSVDLLESAADLLDYQVRSRTEGAARALIAAKLGKILILDEKPEKALEILRATREPRLPQDIKSDRLHVETRALIELDRFEEGEVLIENDRSADAEVLRADIYWGSKDWPRLTTTIRRLLGDGWRRNNTLTALQRLNLVRLSIAMTFSEDRAGLIEMRRRYGTQMKDGDFSNAFDLLTNDQELSGRELGEIASQIASVEKLQSFMRDYRGDFAGQ